MLIGGETEADTKNTLTYEQIQIHVAKLEPESHGDINLDLLLDETQSLHVHKPQCSPVVEFPGWVDRGGETHPNCG